MLIDTTRTEMERTIEMLNAPMFFDSHNPGCVSSGKIDWNFTEHKPDEHDLRCTKISAALGDLSVEDKLGVIDECQHYLRMEQATNDMF